MKNLNELLAEKNEMITKGQILEAIEKFFAADARTVDFTGRKANSKQEAIDGQKKTVELIEKVNEISVHRVGVGNDVTFLTGFRQILSGNILVMICRFLKSSY